MYELGHFGCTVEVLVDDGIPVKYLVSRTGNETSQNVKYVLHADHRYGKHTNLVTELLRLQRIESAEDIVGGGAITLASCDDDPQLTGKAPGYAELSAEIRTQLHALVVHALRLD